MMVKKLCEEPRASAPRAMVGVSKAALGQVSKALEVAQASFQAQVEAIAERARSLMLPYFRAHNYDYKAGNGSWFISRPQAADAAYYRPEEGVDDDELPANIRDMLFLETERGQCLGFFIRDIKRGEW